MERLTLAATWTLSERAGGIWVPRVTRRNIFTTYGLTALASAPGGGYIAPVYLAVENLYSGLNAATSVGATSISLNTRVDQTSDTQIVIDIGTPQQEAATFTSVSGTSAPYTYNLSAGLANAHPANAPVVRQVNENDTLANVTTEVQFDSLNSPGQRLASGSGYSPGNGQYTMQWYFTATMAQAYFATCGLTDNETIGQGNLHNHFVLGYDHTEGTNDVQINGTITILNA